MATKRTPISRSHRRKITPEVIDAFRTMEDLSDKCTCPPVDWGGEYAKPRTCAACEAWEEQHWILHSSLDLAPWVWPAYERPEDECPYPQDHAEFASWHEDRAKPDAFALYEDLRRAAK